MGAAGCAGLLLGHFGVLRVALQALGLTAAPKLFIPEDVRSTSSAAIDALAACVTGQQEALAMALTAIEQQLLAVDEVKEDVAALVPLADEGGVQVERIAGMQQAILGHVAKLKESLGQTGTSLEEMVFSSNEVVSSIQNLTRAAEETTSSTNEMDVSMGRVENQANASSQLSEKVSQDAELGVTAIKQTVEGIDKIKNNNRLAAEVIDRLRQCIDEVSTVLNVIDDVAEQTNLLALNAAIIAAQAGDHGRGFAVVADEIKALAERTGTSTKEISDIILRIQDHSRRVTEVVTLGVQDVEAGMLLGQHAENALHNVVGSAQKSMVMMKGIAQATVEHAKGAKKINSAMGQITETMAQIYYASSEQARGSEVMIGKITTMREAIQQAEGELQVTHEIRQSFVSALDMMRRKNDRVAQAGQRLIQQGQEAIAGGRQAQIAGQKVQAPLATLKAVVGPSL